MLATIAKTAKADTLEYFEFICVLTRPVKDSDLWGEVEDRVEQISIMNNGKPCKPQIEAKIAEYFPGWDLWKYDMPEPVNDLGEPIHIRK